MIYLLNVEFMSIYICILLTQIRVFRYLINEENIPASKVNIISQYNAQCSEIRRRLKNEAFENFLVNTVVSSQGKMFFLEISELFGKMDTVSFEN